MPGLSRVDPETPLRRILHLADLHCGAPLRPGALAAVVRLVEERRPDLVVLAGALAAGGRAWEYRQARELVQALETVSPVLAVPGGRDLRFGAALVRTDPERAFRRWFPEETVFHDDELAVVGAASFGAWTRRRGRLARRALRRLEQRFAALGESSRLCRIAVLHHPLVQVPSLAPLPLARRARAALEVLRRVGVELVLGGHLHHSWAGTVPLSEPLRRGRRARGDGEGAEREPRELHVLHAGSAISRLGRPPESGSNSCLFVEISDASLSVERLVHGPDERRFLGERAWRHERRDAATVVAPVAVGGGGNAYHRCPEPEASRPRGSAPLQPEGQS